jgi:hypothetical protein
MEASRPAPKPRAGVTASAAPAEPVTGAEPVVVEGDAGDDRASGFLQRASLRRRLRYLRRVRELALRDLGAQVLGAHRRGEERDAALDAKLADLTKTDEECESLERALDEHHELALLREPGIAVCPNCSAIHGSEDRFCPQCATAVTTRLTRRRSAGSAAE